MTARRGRRLDGVDGSTIALDGGRRTGNIRAAPHVHAVGANIDTTRNAQTRARRLIRITAAIATDAGMEKHNGQHHAYRRTFSAVARRTAAADLAATRVEPQQANDAVGAALPLLLGALGKNASQPQGAQSLFGALDRDHGGMDLGSVLGAVLGGGMGQGAGAPGGGLGDLLGGLLGGGGRQPSPGADETAGLPHLDGRQADVDGMLGHIFGGRQQRAEDGLGQATGLGSGTAQNLLKILAPIVMSFLAQRFARSGAGAGDLQQALGQEREQIGQQGGLGGGLLGAVLDQDGDGKVDLNDLLKAGAGMLGGRR